jgi:hypothetical protein
VWGCATLLIAHLLASALGLPAQHHPMAHQVWPLNQGLPEQLQQLAPVLAGILLELWAGMTLGSRDPAMPAAVHHAQQRARVRMSRTNSRNLMLYNKPNLGPRHTFRNTADPHRWQ